MQSEPMQVSLSVLMPVYNERHLVAASLKRLLAVQSEIISSMEVIVVDDCSTDGTYEILQKLAQADPRVLLIRHSHNQGKGGAIRTAVRQASKEICIIHDADLEYNPNDIPQVLRPFLEEGADAVFGSRYMAGMYRRVLMYRHTLINKAITALTNWFSDLSLSDVETCYKAVKTPLLKSIPIRSNDFRLEIELSLKLAKRHARIFEVPIRYMPRSYEEGKKIRGMDGLLALLAILKYTLIDDIYHEDQYGACILHDLHSARRFNRWMGDTLRPFVGDAVLELGAGIGNITNQLIPRDCYVASDIDPDYLFYLKSFAQGKPYLDIQKIDACFPEDFRKFHNAFDTVILVNLLEHVADEALALKNIYHALMPGGKAIILVPQGPRLYGSVDRVLEHRERYTREKLARSLEGAGLAVERLFDFNRISVFPWYLNGKVFHRTSFSRSQLKVLEILLPLLKPVDRFLPGPGLSLIAVARRSGEE
jgi:SAM-dependent methyltransferase